MCRSDILNWQYFRNLVIVLFLDQYNHNDNSFDSEPLKEKCPKQPSRDAFPKCSSNPILDFHNKLMEGTKNYWNLLEDISKGIRFYKAAALQPIYLLKKSTPSKENFNDYAKIQSAPTLYRRTTPEAYLEPNRTSTIELFCKKKTSSIFFQSALSQMFDWVLNKPLNSERLLQEFEFMINSPSLVI